jgi:hypothetical protein
LELRSKKAIECENIDQKYSHIRWLLSRLELQAAPVGMSFHALSRTLMPETDLLQRSEFQESVRKPVAVLRNYKKVGTSNSQIKRLQQAILST